jgi:hypothetical protein
LGSSLVANKISSDAQKRAIRKREGTNARLSEARQKLANERLSPLFKDLKVGGEDYFKAAELEDAKNLKTFDDTEQNSEVKIGQGLNLGGNELAEFTALKSDANAETAKRNNARKFFHSQFTGINPSLATLGNEATDLTLNRSKFADELAGKQIGDDLEVASIRPDAGMLALADFIRVAGMAASIGAGGGVAGGSTSTPLSAADAMATFGSSVGGGSTGALSSTVAGGAGGGLGAGLGEAFKSPAFGSNYIGMGRQAFAPQNYMTYGSKIPGSALPKYFNYAG